MIARKDRLARHGLQCRKCGVAVTKVDGARAPSIVSQGSAIGSTSGLLDARSIVAGTRREDAPTPMIANQGTAIGRLSGLRTGKRLVVCKMVVDAQNARPTTHITRQTQTLLTPRRAEQERSTTQPFRMSRTSNTLQATLTPHTATLEMPGTPQTPHTLAMLPTQWTPLTNGTLRARAARAARAARIPRTQ